MPRGVPRLGQAVTSEAEELMEAPVAKSLGSIDLNKIPPKPSFEENGPPPWEVDRGWTKHNTDARRFVDVPDTWELRWLNPRLIDQTGMRDWQAVSTADPRVTLKVAAMGAADCTVRRGSHMGDILCFMPRHWVESRNRLKAEKVARLTQAAQDRQARFTEEVNRGGFGPHIKSEVGMHPTHTMAEGRSMEKD